MERGTEQDRAAFNAWEHQLYFEFDSVKSDKNINVRCTLCVRRKFLSTAKNSTSNLSKHLASWQRNVKLIDKPPDPPTDMTAAATTFNSTEQTADPMLPQSWPEKLVRKAFNQSINRPINQTKYFINHARGNSSDAAANSKHT